VREGRPFCAQYWTASFSATSTAVEPSSLKTRSQTGPMTRRAGLMTRRAGAARRDAAQRLGQFRCGRVRHAGERAVAVLARLLFERRHEPRVVVAERRHPPRRIGVEIAASVGVEEPRALRAHHYDRVDARGVFVHRRVRVPDPPLVEGDDPLALHRLPR
jgi:hypothetical protein